METSFAVVLQKPNFYLISWTRKDIPKRGIALSGVVWSDGRQPYLYLAAMNAYWKARSDELALTSATGVSDGATFTMPSLFFPVFKDANPLPRLINPRIEGNEAVEGDECYVICGASITGTKETYWISRSEHLIRQDFLFLQFYRRR